jgi:S-formylglutathione hydrolase FrmB
LEKKMTTTLADTFGCGKELANCSPAYVAEWSPVEGIDADSPPMFLAASVGEKRAWPSDQTEVVKALQAHGIAGEADIVETGHAFEYFGKVREAMVAFIDQRL